MKIITNEKLVKRNRKIGQITTLVGLGILGAGVYLTFQNDAKYISWSFAALIIGFTLSQVSLYTQNRWGRNPRTDDVINQSLKGLDDRYTILHYITPTSHLLIGPCGIWSIIPYYLKGTITYTGGRWHQKGGNLYLKIFAQESIGRPDSEAETAIHSVQEQIRRRMDSDVETPPVQVALVFIDPSIKFDLPEDAPMPAFQIKKLKDFVRRESKDSTIAPELEDKILACFDSPK
jgi:hypothetical protein